MTLTPADLLAADPVLQRSERVAVLGAGVIGTSWTGVLLAHGLAVTVHDPAPDAETRTRQALDALRPSLAALGLPTDGLADRLAFAPDVASAVAGADVVQENGPERLDVKQRLWEQVEAACRPEALLLSSTSGVPASAQAEHLSRPERLLVGHPFNPPHMVPLVEVVPGGRTEPAAVEDAVALFRALGKKPLVLRKEIGGFVANRLQSALFRECIHLVSEGVVALDDLDEIVTSSIGLRWAAMGPFLTFHLGGGPGGLAHFFEQFGPGMERRWASLGSPRVDEATVRLLLDEVERAYGDETVEELAARRDRLQLALLRAREAAGADGRTGRATAPTPAVPTEGGARG